jgi:hypothetical protein
MFKLKKLSSFSIVIAFASISLLSLGTSARLEAQTSSPYDGASIPFESMPEYSADSNLKCNTLSQSRYQPSR